MKCLCCGKTLKTENESGWHKSCIRKFFGTTQIPQIDVDDNTLETLATMSVDKGYTVPGVQKKLSLHLLSQGGTPRLTLVDYPAGYILKPQVEQFEALPESEHLVMCMADAVGIATVPHALIRNGSNYAYITKRIDRVLYKDFVEKLAMEDFCQLDLRLTQDKYHGSYEQCGKIIKRFSERSKLDLSELFIRIVFFYITGNSDMHLKNFSLIETEVRSMKYVLSAAYDLLPVKVNMPEDREDFALAMNGKKTNIRKKDFFLFAENIGINKEITQKMIAQLVAKKDMLQSMCMESYLPEHLKTSLYELIENRCSVLMS
ncbi:MAG TPA: HipA domain-containing protein [Bacillota bacterium]|nr:HipA domain-containing protein [Bacillota bacterium]HPF42422.1 HipA domain-containing protein [Bacillota bacterium]HPJ85445.1 HipA domain-containing protein [Bacillota bacterium]HPQ61259.1 HipA domain-containing protein [Bacillota bacterium]HRX91657.1 HipA domain-containing protein [Candidatus Izemoplasmatales bacterium]